MGAKQGENTTRGRTMPSHALQTSRGRAALATLPDPVTASFWGVMLGPLGFLSNSSLRYITVKSWDFLSEEGWMS